MNKLVLGLAAAASLGAAVLGGTGEARAQGFSLTIGTPGYFAPVGRPYWAGPPPYAYGHRPYRRHWAPVQAYGGPVYGGPVYGGPVYGAPVYGYHRGPRCFVKPVTYWDGWGYVTRHRRVCR